MVRLEISDVMNAFPAPTFRKYQKAVLRKITEAFNSGVKCVLLDAPTGFGKSLVNATFCRLMRSFYATPQLSLIQQILRDRFLKGIFVEIEGRQNYKCFYDPSATVDIGLCKRVADFNCPRFEVCPYWKQKLKALEAKAVLTSFSYLLLEGMTETKYSLGRRKLLVLDEAHGIDRHIIDHISITVSPYSLPKSVYDRIAFMIRDFEDVYDLISFMETVAEIARSKLETYRELSIQGELSKDEARNMTKIEEFLKNVDTFLASPNKWVWQIGRVRTPWGVARKLSLMPLYARDFAEEMLWNRADLFIISSATILDPARFVKEVGLDLVFNSDETLHIMVPSTFPPENRPIIDVSIGKLTKDRRDKVLPEAIKMIKEILEYEKGNVAIHCHSYEMAEKVAEALKKYFPNRIITHNSENRDEMLRKWMNSRGKVFVCVDFYEGQDWKGDICEAQILLKTPYPDLSDRRVAKRLELGHWNWYFYEALKKSIQAYGRAVRGPDEKKRFYVIDESFWILLKRTRKVLPAWFIEALPKDRRKWLGI